KNHQSPESVVREIKRKTRRKFPAEEKIRIILEGLKLMNQEYWKSAKERWIDDLNYVAKEAGIELETGNASGNLG
ncbi:MAG: hypothetical protein KAS98_16060, partial [Deltaproteobacteria bacterium]|nr:hypothetical protein [Deltaproteobacteria bacterium]